MVLFVSFLNVFFKANRLIFPPKRSQIIMNEEATMSRKGLDPVSRKTKTPGGRKKAGFCVYLAYQLLDNVNFDQMVGESINKHVDVNLKKKQLLAALSGNLRSILGLYFLKISIFFQEQNYCLKLTKDCENKSKKFENL